MIGRLFERFMDACLDGNPVIFGAATGVLLLGGAPYLYPILTGAVTLKSCYNIVANKYHEYQERKADDRIYIATDAEYKERKDLYQATRAAAAAAAAADPGTVVDLEKLRHGGPS